MQKKFSLLMVGAIALLSGNALFAHHGSRVSYDMKKMVTLTGTVAEFQ